MRPTWTETKSAENKNNTKAEEKDTTVTPKTQPESP
jgi:hypothetical protein